VRRAVEGGADFVGVAGGDGTLRTGAEPLIGRPVPLLPVPTGTRNHFARQLGIDDLDAAKDAIGGRTMQVDIAEVNGRPFINNSALGVYPSLVARRERLQEKGLPKGVAQLIASLMVLAPGHRVTVRVDGVPCRAWMVFVGNGHYGENLFDLASRDTLNQHILDVRILRGDHRLSRLRVLAEALLGRISHSTLLDRKLCQRVEIDADLDQVDVAIDGEVETLSPPLRYRSRPSVLAVLIPGDPDAAKPHVLRLAPLGLHKDSGER
jgi:undecaprenyl-diphosphatase